MGSSSKDYAGRKPANQAPVAGMTPTPVAQPAPPVNFPQFLPGDPTAMASGLTPEHVAAIANMSSPAAAPPAVRGPAAASAGTGGQGDTGTNMYVPPEVTAAGPDTVQSYVQAKQTGNDALAARILLSAKIMAGDNPNRQGSGFGGGNRAGYTTSAGGPSSSAVGRAGLV